MEGPTRNKANHEGVQACRRALREGPAPSDFEPLYAPGAPALGIKVIDVGYLDIWSTHSMVDTTSQDRVDIWRWQASGFDDDVPGGRNLNADLRELGRRHGQTFILMEATFPKVPIEDYHIADIIVHRMDNVDLLELLLGALSSPGRSHATVFPIISHAGLPHAPILRQDHCSQVLLVHRACDCRWLRLH